MPAATQESLTWKFWLPLISLTVLGWLLIIASSLWRDKFRAHPHFLLSLLVIGLLCMVGSLSRAVYLRITAKRLAASSPRS